MKRMKVALTIGGSDSCCGAGIQADLKTFLRCGVYGASALTAVTAQNPSRVRSVFPLPPRVVAAQIDAVTHGLKVAAVKTGMLRSEGAVRAVARKLREHDLRPLVIDPVIVAHGGRRLLSRVAERAMLEYLFPLADLVTPNIPEAERLTGVKITSPERLMEAARRLVGAGARSVLITGGHGESRSIDWYYDGRKLKPLAAKGVEGINLHGSGCILSAAITAGVARGFPMEAAVRFGKRYVTREMRLSWKVGSDASLALHD